MRGGGQVGVSLNDRKLAASIRTKLLKEAGKILDGDNESLKRDLLCLLAWSSGC